MLSERKEWCETLIHCEDHRRERWRLVGIADQSYGSLTETHRAQIAGLWRALSIRPLPTKVKTRAEALRLTNLHCSRVRVVGHESAVLVLQWFGSVDVRTRWFRCNWGHVLFGVLDDLDGLDVLEGHEVLDGLGLLDKLKVFDGLDVLVSRCSTVSTYSAVLTSSTIVTGLRCLSRGAQWSQGIWPASPERAGWPVRYRAFRIVKRST